ncbi:MAG: hypothetical protein HKN11_14220 [Rhizobiales bacterium]|nr:hypothetical protein [Hyphomicrobiales bacterium]
MRIISFIFAGLLVLAGGGCVVTWASSSPSIALDAGFFLVGGFGLLPLIGGALLFRYAWKDRGGKRGGQ